MRTGRLGAALKQPLSPNVVVVVNVVADVVMDVVVNVVADVVADVVVVETPDEPRGT